MSSKKSGKPLFLFVAPFMLTACQMQDVSTVRPDFTRIKNIATSIVSIGKRPASSISVDIDGPSAGKPLSL